jgi:tripartite motif-containing protein 71
VAVDANGYVYVSDTSNDRIVKLSPQGKPFQYWGSIGSGPGQFNSPAGLTVDAKGNLFVADTDNELQSLLYAA